MNTTFAKLEVENGPVECNDHNGKLEVVPSRSDCLILSRADAARLISVLAEWLAKGDCDDA